MSKLNTVLEDFLKRYKATWTSQNVFFVDKKDKALVIGNEHYEPVQVDDTGTEIARALLKEGNREI